MRTRHWATTSKNKLFEASDADAKGASVLFVQIIGNTMKSLL